MTLEDQAKSFAKVVASDLQGIDPDDAQKSALNQLKSDLAIFITAASVDFSELLDVEKRLLRFLSDDALRRRVYP
jgi:hypothetical protein